LCIRDIPGLGPVRVRRDINEALPYERRAA
jgi:hypothetical protein